MAIKGDHSATPKGTNGTADPKARAQTYHTKDGVAQSGTSPAEGDHSREATIVRAK
jgi:hypothetical protein